MVKISVIGICGNSVFLPVDHFHAKGETVVAPACFEQIGGKGLNQAVAAARMGAQVSFLAAIGDDGAGKTCVEVVEGEGIEGHFALRKGEKTAFAAILTDKTGENRVTVYMGPELCREDVLAYESRIAESDVLLLQHEVPEHINLVAAELAKKHGVRVILNPAPAREMSARLAELVDLATPNEHEAASVHGLPFGNVVTTLGGDGCCINGTVTIPALPVTAVDTTGAGDTFNGVLAVYLAEGMDLENACCMAVKASGIGVTRKGALTSIPYRQEVEEA